MAAVAQGSAMITENLFEARFRTVQVQPGAQHIRWQCQGDLRRAQQNDAKDQLMFSSSFMKSRPPLSAS